MAAARPETRRCASRLCMSNSFPGGLGRCITPILSVYRNPRISTACTYVDPEDRRGKWTRTRDHQPGLPPPGTATPITTPHVPLEPVPLDRHPRSPAHPRNTCVQISSASMRSTRPAGQARWRTGTTSAPAPSAPGSACGLVGAADHRPPAVLIAYATDRQLIRCRGDMARYLRMLGNGRGLVALSDR